MKLFLLGLLVSELAPVGQSRASGVVLRGGSTALETTTSQAGEFRFPAVVPGVYDLAAAVGGFEPVAR